AGGVRNGGTTLAQRPGGTTCAQSPGGTTGAQQAIAERRVGRSGLRVSRVGLGTGTWGIETDAVDAGELLAAFAAAGGTLVDTGPHYTDGRAEEMLGSLLG